MQQNRKWYNQWAATYDTTVNPTRDLDLKVTKEALAAIPKDHLLELGGGTGKHTQWLLPQTKAHWVLDFSEEMLQKLKGKCQAEHLKVCQADLTAPWEVPNNYFDLIMVNLVLEHIEKLPFVFEEAQRVLKKGGYFWVSEFHPYKQYLGSKARFDTAAGVQKLNCFTHHLSDYWQAAQQQGFELVQLGEWSEKEAAKHPPRLLTLLFRK